MENAPPTPNEEEKLIGLDTVEPWWKRISGTFANDPMYREAMDLGRQYRNEKDHFEESD